MFTGSCLCQAIRFELNGELSSPRYCHCNKCVKFSGTSPAAWAMATSAELSLVNPNAEVTKFNSGRGLRCFCSNCGSGVWFESIDFPEIVGIPLGVIDEGEIPTPEQHLWVNSKPDWCTINDELPQREQGPE
ncbi:MAG: GFA family protein [Pseudomonadales bacterium]|nr:GFA family protein [Pseudomonadales bacterium]